MIADGRDQVTEPVVGALPLGGGGFDTLRIGRARRRVDSPRDVEMLAETGRQESVLCSTVEGGVARSTARSARSVAASDLVAISA